MHVASGFLHVPQIVNLSHFQSSELLTGRCSDDGPPTMGIIQ